MLKVMYRSDDSYVSCRAGVYYYIRRVPYDVRQHYASKRLSFSLKTKSYAGALRADSQRRGLSNIHLSIIQSYFLFWRESYGTRLM